VWVCGVGDRGPWGQLVSRRSVKPDTSAGSTNFCGSSSVWMRPRSHVTADQLLRGFDCDRDLAGVVSLDEGDGRRDRREIDAYSRDGSRRGCFPALDWYGSWMPPSWSCRAMADNSLMDKVRPGADRAATTHACARWGDRLEMSLLREGMRAGQELRPHQEPGWGRDRRERGGTRDRETWVVGMGAPSLEVHTYPENRHSLPQW
jgi:hypothetical protein